MAVEEHERFDPQELDAGHETVARRLEALQGGLRTVERTLHPSQQALVSALVLDLAAPEPGSGALHVEAAARSEPPAERLVTVPVVVDVDPPAEADAPPARPAADAWSHAGPSRPSLWRSFRAWWTAERLAREQERRAHAAAAAAAKSRELQGLQPSSSAEHVQAIRAVMTLTEERFQALGLRSDRLHDELLGISNAISELRDAAATGGTIHLPAADAAEELQERLDAVLLALAEEFRRRSEEIERSLSAQMAIQNAELAMLLEDALVRMRSLIPEEMAKVAAEVSATVERAVAAIPPPVSVFGPVPRAQI